MSYKPTLYLLLLAQPFFINMRILFIIILIIFTRNGWAQFTIAQPVINTGNYAITDTVYMAIDGDDANPGTFDFTRKIF
jgi:hypothetical protein